jgi:hypothetical protein
MSPSLKTQGGGLREWVTTKKMQYDAPADNNTLKENKRHFQGFYFRNKAG